MRDIGYDSNCDLGKHQPRKIEYLYSLPFLFVTHSGGYCAERDDRGKADAFGTMTKGYLKPVEM